MLISDQFGIKQNLQMSPIPRTSFLVGTFVADPYNKATLATISLKLKKFSNARFGASNGNFWTVISYLHMPKMCQSLLNYVLDMNMSIKCHVCKNLWSVFFSDTVQKFLVSRIDSFDCYLFPSQNSTGTLSLAKFSFQSYERRFNLRCFHSSKTHRRSDFCNFRAFNWTI